MTYWMPNARKGRAPGLLKLLDNRVALVYRHGAEKTT